MRYLAIGLCILMAACSSSAPTAPAALAGAGTTRGDAATAGSNLPFQGTLAASESVDGNAHHLAGSGIGSHLGRFTYAADLFVDPDTGDGTGTVTYTAASGDEITARTAGAIVSLDYPTLRLREQQTITGGSGRFATASGTVVVERVLDLDTGATTGSFDGALSLGR